MWRAKNLIFGFSYDKVKDMGQSKNINLKNIVWREGKHYVAQCLNVDVSSFGRTRTEALTNLDEALELYFEDTKTLRPVRVERPEVLNLSFSYA